MTIRGAPAQYIGTMMITRKKVRKELEEQPMRYWLVDITLTSGEGLHFYVSAINEYEANLKVDGYVELADNEDLRKCYKGMGFKLLP